MAQVLPAGKVWLLKNIPWSGSYAHTKYFENATAQHSWICSSSHVIGSSNPKTAQNYIKDPLHGTIKLAGHQETYLSAASVCNYICFQNTDISDGTGQQDLYVYAFVDDIRFVSNSVFELDYTIDVVQTFLMQGMVSLKQCYIERIHPTSDNVGAHLEPENINFGNYVYQNAESQNKWTVGYDNYRPLVFSTYELRSFKATPSSVKNRILWGKRAGIMQGLVVNVFKDMNSLLTFFDDFEEGGTLQDRYSEVLNSIVAIVAVPPEFAQPETDFSTYEVDILKNDIYVGGDNVPSGKTSYMEFTMRQSGELGSEVRLSGSSAGYTPNWNKLYTYPYNSAVITNCQGQSLELRYEYFGTASTIPSSFRMRYRVSIQPNFEITVFPINYAGKVQDLDNSIDVGQFPIVPYVSDAYQQWLASSKTASNLSALTSVLTTGAGLMTGGLSLASIGALSGGMGVSSLYDASVNAKNAPDKVVQGYSAPKMLAGANTIRCYQRCVNEIDARRIDDYFDEFGYACGKVTTPHLKNDNTYQNYVKTAGCTITGGAPSKALEKIEQVFNSGITIWDGTVGEYGFKS